MLKVHRKWITGAILMGLMGFLPVAPALAVSDPTDPVFFSEIHYDNDGTDTGEAIEIFGPAGTDLTGWSVVLYNGSNGTVYDTQTLSGSIPDLDNGFGVVVVNYGTNGVQNGAPDGLALVDGSGTLRQFLSYEGAFTAVGGAADGGFSTDILVSESSSTPTGASLQLIGSGACYGDFTWSSGASTFGTVAPMTPVAGDCGDGGGGDEVPPVRFSELHYDNAGTDVGEAIEIFGPAGTDLAGWTVVLYNGSNGTAYDTQTLSGSIPDLDAGSGVVVVNYGTNGIQNGAPDGLALADASGALVEFLSYEGAFTGVGGAADGVLSTEIGVSETSSTLTDQSLQRAADGDWGGPACASFGSINEESPDVLCPAAPLEVLIHDVQGNGSVSPLDGQTVEITGIVVGDFQDDVGTNGDLNGFYVQEEDVDADGDAMTSEGIFVFNGSNPTVDVQIGDLVTVEGSVSEFNGLTEITSFTGVSVISNGNALPTVAALSLPVTNVDDFETTEGMYVTFPQALVISEYFNYDRFGEIVLTSERHLTPTAEFEPGSSDVTGAVAEFLLDKITLDDGRSAQNPDPAIHPNGGVFDLDNLFRGGDTVANVTGVMDYSFGLWRIQPTEGADYTNTNARTANPDPVGGSLSVATFNVLNYFTTLDNSGPICGPSSNQDCRGADNATEFTRQRDKIIAAMAAIDADVFGLMEIENHPGDVPAADLVAGLNAVAGAETYAYLETGAIGTDAIRQAILYKPASVSLVGAYAVLDSSVDARFNDEKNRPVLAQTFIDDSTGGIFTVAVNHLKSKGSACNDIGDADLGDGAGNCNLTRKAAAEALVDWLASDPTGSGDEDFMIIGDLNSYDKEDPIDVLLANGYDDLIYSFLGEDAYSYVFDGQIGYLDYALANAGLSDEVSGLTIWHINADEPDAIDYDTSFKKDAQDAIYAPDPYRSSDHDPVIVGLDVCDEIAPTIDSLSVTPNELLKPNHKYVDVTASILVSDNFDTNPTVTLVSVTSSEPDNGEDDGDTINDIVIVDDFHFKLRAERSGVGQGRTYTITYQVEDACGNITVDSVTVFVPLSRGK